MVQRLNVKLDDNLVRKLRKMQAQLVKDSAGSVSFSYVLNETVKKGLKSK